jgi:acetyl esterase/lipase
MIHGGGHVMLSRKDIRPKQTQMLLEQGFLPISIDYRLCPEVTLPDGPMRDVCDALEWARSTLPTLTLQRDDIRVTGRQVVAVGWSTGGHLALTLGFTAPIREIAPPDAILAFYCPTDYEDSFWKEPNMPFGRELAPPLGEKDYDLRKGVFDQPITAYNPPAKKRALGGWMATDDARSRIALHMNWRGQALPILLNGFSRDSTLNFADPTPEQVQSISPLAQIRQGKYKTPTYLIHGTRDDLIPWQQVQRTYDALRERDIAAEMRLLDGAEHLFDIYPGFIDDEAAVSAVRDGYQFLTKYV